MVSTGFMELRQSQPRKDVRPAQVFAYIFFVALLCVPSTYRRFDPRRPASPASAGTEAARASALANYGFYLTESSQAAGIRFRHTSPHLDSKLDHIREQVASMGAAVSVVDFDRDGLADFYVTNSGEGSKNAWERFGETTITMVTKTCFCTNGASPSFTTTMAANTSRV
jgi:hypothetical protein